MGKRKIAGVHLEIVEDDHRVISILVGAIKRMHHGKFVDSRIAHEDFGKNAVRVEKLGLDRTPVNRFDTAQGSTAKQSDHRVEEVYIPIAEFDAAILVDRHLEGLRVSYGSLGKQRHSMPGNCQRFGCCRNPDASSPARIQIVKQGGDPRRAVGSARVVSRPRARLRVDEREVAIGIDEETVVRRTVVRKRKRQFDELEVVILQIQRRSFFGQGRSFGKPRNCDSETVLLGGDRDRGLG